VLAVVLPVRRALCSRIGRINILFTEVWKLHIAYVVKSLIDCDGDARRLCRGEREVPVWASLALIALQMAPRPTGTVYHDCRHAVRKLISNVRGLSENGGQRGADCRNFCPKFHWNSAASSKIRSPPLAAEPKSLSFLASQNEKLVTLRNVILYDLDLDFDLDLTCVYVNALN